jgi:hypothetical protein
LAEKSVTCPKASRHGELVHVELGEGEWAHLKRKLGHSAAQAIESAQLAANYETAGASALTQALVKAALTSAPADWRLGYTDADGSVREGQLEPTMALVGGFLDQYETDHELALMSPKTRQNMAQARMDLFDTYARSFFVESSTGDSWPLADGMHCEIVEQRARSLWNDWMTEVQNRLKAAGADSD